MENNQISFNLNKGVLRKAIVIGLAVLVFIFAFCNWYSMSVTEFGYTLSDSFGPYGGPTLSAFGEEISGSLSDISGWCVVAKVFLIIDLIVFAVYMVSNFIDLGAYIPNVSGKMIKAMAYKGYFVIMAIALFCALLGDFTCEGTEYVHMEGGWYLTLIFTIAGLVNAFNPDLLKNALNKIK